LRFILSRLVCLLSGPAICFLPFLLRGASPEVPHLGVVRLDDQLASAQVSASKSVASANAAEPIVWHNFFATSDITWQLVRGRMGVRNGDLIVKGDGSTPVIFSPIEAAIDWKLYQAVEIRMSAQSGHEIKIKIGDFEAKKELGAPGQYNVYHFDIDVDAPKGRRVLGLMPTDSMDDAVAIHSITLIPKPATFTSLFGMETLGKNDEYRHAVYIHSPSILTFPLTIPANAHLHVGMGTTVKGSPITFRIAVEGATGDLLSRTIDHLDRWEDADLDLSRWGGKSIRLQLRTETAHAGEVGLWTNPLLTTGAKKPRPNVLIYTMDTARADHASLYGYARNTTPFLKRLAASGVSFNDCQAQAPWTKSSVASLLTSLYSFTHGIVSDADTIPAGAATLAGQLRTAGYVTASISASPFTGRATGLERGFDTLLESPVIQRQINQQTDRGTDSMALNRVVFRWLDNHADEPFFLYAHSTDPHAPYEPPPPFDAAFGKPSETIAFDRAYASLRTDHDSGGGDVISREMCQRSGNDPDSFLRQAIERYDGEIQHNDRSLELLLGKLKQLGILDNTLVIVVSDHGEEFWDHGWTAHAHSVYAELTHVLFLMWNPALLPTPRQITEPVQLIDVMPTILDLLGLKTPEMVEGQSLTPLIAGRPFKRRGLVISSRFAAARAAGPVPESFTDSFAITDAHWKFIYRNKAAKAGVKKVELYDRLADHTERHDIAAEHPHEVENMTEALSQWIDAQNQVRLMIGHPGVTQLDRKTVDQLRSLGYLGGTSQ
jgi:arylsulfatase A-like enzyme